MSEPRQIKCALCGGYGMVSDYSGGDFHGAMECRDCEGNGLLFVWPSGRVALYPGGPLKGSWPGAYESERTA